MADVALRPIDDSDLDALFDQMRDPESVQMAAFTAKDPNDREAFDTHMSKLRASPDVTLRAVIRGGRLVGSMPASSWRATPRSPTGSTALSGDKASPAKPLPSSSTRFRSGLCVPAPPATTSDRSGCGCRILVRLTPPAGIRG